MKRITLFFTVLTVVLLSACGNGGQSQEHPGLPEMVEVDLRLPEGSLDPGAEIVLEAYVSQGGEAVEDANEVEFEVRRDGDEESDSFDGQHQGEGIYTATKQFTEEGTYSITAHVTARDMHNMPTKELVIGNPSEVTEDPTDQPDSHNEEGDPAQEHDHQ